jgi:hypothetical protein
LTCSFKEPQEIINVNPKSAFPRHSYVIIKAFNHRYKSAVKDSTSGTTSWNESTYFDLSSPFSSMADGDTVVSRKNSGFFVFVYEGSPGEEHSLTGYQHVSFASIVPNLQDESYKRSEDFVSELKLDLNAKIGETAGYIYLFIFIPSITYTIFVCDCT